MDRPGDKTHGTILSAQQGRWRTRQRFPALAIPFRLSSASTTKSCQGSVRIIKLLRNISQSDGTNKFSHWPVFWASFAVVLVTWGLVPTQAGIFSVRTVTRSNNMTFDVSTFNVPIAQQASSLTFRYSQSTYGIVSLNETLPPYMARNYTLAPFRPT